MNKLLAVWMVFAAVLFVSGEPAQAAGRDLSGVWKLDSAKSDYGKFPAPLNVTRKITHHDQQLDLSTTQTGPRGDVTNNLTYTTDGKEAVNGDSKGSAQWIGDKLMIESSREFQGAALKQKEIWTLSGDGKTLTVDSHVSLPNGEFDVRQVFDKQ